MKNSLVAICSVVLLSCVYDNTSKLAIKCSPINLFQTDDFTKTVIVYEDSVYLIKAPLDSFVNDISSFYKFASDNMVYTRGDSTMLLDSDSLNILIAKNYFDDGGGRLRYITVLILQKGDCFVYSKKDKSPVKNGCIQYWGNNGFAGRKIYFNNVEFIETVDYIS